MSRLQETIAAQTEPIRLLTLKCRKMPRSPARNKEELRLGNMLKTQDKLIREALDLAKTTETGEA